MKRVRLVIVIACAVLLAGFGVHQSAAAGTLTVTGATCTSVDVTGDTGHPNTGVNVGVSGFGLGTNGVTDSSGHFSFTVHSGTGPINGGTTTNIVGRDSLGYNASIFYTFPNPCINGSNTPSFTSDGRVEPHAGDRLAIWCNTTATPPNLDVWGVYNDSSGHQLFQFNFADLIKAGAKGIFKNIEPAGAVFASVDSNNNFYVAWFGGPAGATGSGDFAKSFNCGFTR